MYVEASSHWYKSLPVTLMAFQVSEPSKTVEYLSVNMEEARLWPMVSAISRWRGPYIFQIDGLAVAACAERLLVQVNIDLSGQGESDDKRR